MVVPEEDRSAIITAIMKAAIEGARIGVADMTARVTEIEPELRVELSMDTFRAPDRWQELYGDGNE